MNLYKYLFILITLCYLPHCSYSQRDIYQNTDPYHLEKLISADSIYEATLLLNEELNYAKSHNLSLSVASANEKLGDIFYKIESYETASSYYLKAFQVFDSLNQKEEVDRILSNLARNHVHARNYKRFDSIIPIALEYSEQLNSINLFYNLGSKIIKNYSVRNFEASQKYAEEALLKLKTFSFYNEKDIAEKPKLAMSFSYYQALSLINLKQYDKGYELLFEIDPDQLSMNVQHNTVPLTQIATLNYYKFRYFNEHTTKADSANNYLLKSDFLKYNVIKEFQNKLSKNGDLIYRIINTENQLELAEAKREQDKTLANAFLIATIILSLVLAAMGVFFYYYYSNRKQIKEINLKLKHSNKKLKLIDKERLEFFSILSHELRTPIYGISGLATLIEQEQSPEKRRGYLNALSSSSHYISVLIDNVLQISKLKFEQKNLHLKPTNIFQLAQKIASSIKISSDQKGLELYTNMEKTNPDELLLADNVALSQILINLTYNAIRYTSKGFVSINISEQHRTDTHVNLLFEIKDSGIGIQHQHKNIIFNAFENKTFLEKNSSGSGLGLYIVKTLLKSHNSEIKFLSEANQGSTFYFDINFEISDVPKQQTQYVHEDPDSPSKILIVDDNTINLMITQKNIEKISGFICETVTNGKEAICLIKEKDFDMVLMDINMPDMDGFEATKHIRMFNPSIPILALTALNSNEIKDKAYACGMNYVITKPFDFDEFKTIILRYNQVLQD